MSPPLAILVGLVSGLAVFLAMARVYAGFVWPQGKIGVFAYFKWIASMAAGFLVYYYIPWLLVPQRDCECIGPDPWGVWLYVYGAIGFSILIAITYIAERTRNLIDWSRP